MSTDYIDSRGLYHFIRDDDDIPIVTTDKEYIEQMLGRKFKDDRADSLSYVRYSVYGIKEEKEMTKVITVIGSISEVNNAAMLSLYNRLTYKGINVKLPYMDRVPEDASDEQIKLLHDLHEEKMDSANLIIVVDADGHIGKDTQREIDWCINHNKTMIYLSDMQVNEEDKQTKGGKK